MRIGTQAFKACHRCPVPAAQEGSEPLTRVTLFSDMAATSSPYRIQVRSGSSVATQPRTSVIALVTNETTMLQLCLESLDRTISPSDRPEIIVLANGTPAHELTVLERREDLVLIASPTNHGFAGGCNLAVRYAHGERLVFLNDDTVVANGWLDGLHRALDSDPDAAVVGSKVLCTDGRLQEAGCVLWSDGSTTGVGRGRPPHEPEFAFTRPVDYVSFCCAMVRRSAWQEAGGFDERYFPAYYEDLDLCLTLHQLGWKVVYEPTSTVHHSEGGSASRGFRDFLSRRNQAAFVAKWSSLLEDYEDPPASETRRSDAVARALRRAAHRQVPARSRAVGAQLSASVAALDDLDSLVLQLRHATAALAVTDEYIRVLSEEASKRGYLDVLRDRARMNPVLGRIIRPLRHLGRFVRPGG
jgi:GT2 family glycosyltransferase